MSRVGGGDGEQKVENESSNAHRLNNEAVESLTGAGQESFFGDDNPDPFLDVKDTTNVGKNQDKLVNLE